jgi:putative Mn2+ efflux pump MntP
MEQEHYSSRLMFRMVLVMTLFQVIFLGIGWLIGQAVYFTLENARLLLAFIIFTIIGLKMFWESFRLDPKMRTFDIEKTSVLMTVASAAGFSSLVVGTGMNLAGHILFISLISIASMSFVLLLLGSFIGKLFGCRYRGRFAKTVGGILLILAGIRCLLEFRGIDF